MLLCATGATAKAKEWSQMFDQTDFWFAFKLQGGLKTVSFSSMPCRDSTYHTESAIITSRANTFSVNTSDLFFSG